MAYAYMKSTKQNLKNWFKRLIEKKPYINLLTMQKLKENGIAPVFYNQKIEGRNK